MGVREKIAAGVTTMPTGEKALGLRSERFVSVTFLLAHYFHWGTERGSTIHNTIIESPRLLRERGVYTQPLLERSNDVARAVVVLESEREACGWA